MIVIVVDMVTHNNHFKSVIVCCLRAISSSTYNKTTNACLISCDNKVDQEKWGCDWHKMFFFLVENNGSMPPYLDDSFKHVANMP
jgi:hypothetical protein